MLLLPQINSKEKELIYSKAVQFLYQQEPLVVFILPLFAGSLCFGLSNSVPYHLLLIWEIAIILLSVLRYILYRLYFSFNPQKKPLPWAYYHTALSFCFGLAWVFPTYFFLEQMSDAGFSIWFVSHVGNFVVAIPLLSYWYPSFFAYSLPYTIAIPPLLYNLGIIEYQAFSLLILVAGGFSYVLIYYTHQFVLDSIAMRFQNLKLIDQLKREKTVAEQANQTKTRFLATASHDLRQPLYALGLYRSLLKQKLNHASQYELMDNLEQAELALNSLLDALLDISKFDAGQIKINQQTIECHHLMHQLVIEFEPQFKQKKLDFRIHPQTLIIETDPILLSRILRNLLHNALRYTFQGGVLFSARLRSPCIEFQIWDTGQGIAQDKQSLIFEDFMQLHNTERQQQQGLGLGLSIVQRIAKLLNYPIQLKSTLNKGSVFSIQVPLSKKTKATPSVIVPVNNPIEITTLFNLNIILVEDQKEVLRATELLLENWGCTVIGFRCFEQLKSHLDNNPQAPDVIITDYRLPPPNTGIDVIKYIQLLYKQSIPALIITGDTAAAQLNILIKSGIPILYKPLKIARLRAFLLRINNIK